MGTEDGEAGVPGGRSPEGNTQKPLWDQGWENGNRTTEVISTFISLPTMTPNQAGLLTCCEPRCRPIPLPTSLPPDP